MSDYSFEKLKVYAEARELRKDMYRLAKALPKTEQYSLASQIRRAAVSLTNNIAEGHGRYHYQENIQFLRHSRGSLEELLDDLNVCVDECYVDKDYIESLKQDACILLKKLNSYIKYLKGRKAIQINQSPINKLTNHQLTN